MIFKKRFCCGFVIASSTPDLKHYARLSILSYDHIEVKYDLNAYQTPHFRVWEVHNSHKLIFNPVHDTNDKYAPFGRRRKDNI